MEHKQELITTTEEELESETSTPIREYQLDAQDLDDLRAGYGINLGNEVTLIYVGAKTPGKKTRKGKELKKAKIIEEELWEEIL